MKEYNVLWHNDIRSLIEKVNKEILLRWECQGGICANTYDAYGDTEWFYQAMVREQENKGE